MTNLIPAAISSQLDQTGEERIHAAPYEVIVRPVYVPAPPAVPAIFLTGDGDSDFFLVSQGNVVGPLTAPESPDFSQQLARLSSGRLVARGSGSYFYSDDEATTWFPVSYNGDNNSSLLEVNGVLLVGGVGLIDRSVNNGDSWTFVLTAGNAIDFCTNGTVIVALCSDTSNLVKRSTDNGLTWIDADLTGLGWSGPSVTGFSRYAAAVGDTFVLAGREFGTSNPAILVSNDAGVTWERKNLPSAVGTHLVNGVATDGTTILIARGKAGGPENGTIFRYNIDTEDFTTVVAATGYYTDNLWHIEGVWYCSLFAYDGSATWLWSSDGVTWAQAAYPGGYNEMRAMAYNATGANV